MPAGLFAQKGYTPLSDFYKIWLREGVPGHTLMWNFIVVALKMWAYSV